jgi:thiamine biosynthesis protein ThiI
LPANILVRYGELALKSPPVRREFERALERNILEQFRVAGLACRLRADHGHLYVAAEEATSAVPILRRVFGVTSVSSVDEVPSERAAIEQKVLELVDAPLRPGRSFAVRARRTGRHPFTSQEIARDLGASVLTAFADRGLRVDLDHPEVEVHVELRGPRTYVYLDRSSGPGGLPLGVAGQVAALVDGPRGGLGAYLLMKRGCRSAVVGSGPGEALARAVLGRFDPRLRIVPGGPDALATLETLAAEVSADAVVLPLAVEEYGQARARWGDRVVFSPTVGMSEQEVETRWQAVVELAA